MISKLQETCVVEGLKLISQVVILIEDERIVGCTIGQSQQDAILAVWGIYSPPRIDVVDVDDLKYVEPEAFKGRKKQQIRISLTGSKTS